MISIMMIIAFFMRTYEEKSRDGMHMDSKVASYRFFLHIYCNVQRNCEGEDEKRKVC